MSAPPPGDRDGATYDSARDRVRLSEQHIDVWQVLRDGRWHSLAGISAITGHPEASISARLRDFRKEQFGAHAMDRKRSHYARLFLYRLTPRVGDE